jgi:hypothetical protein
MFRIGNWFLFLGGIISFFVSSLFFGVCGFFGLRRKMREIFKGKVIKVEVKGDFI